MYKNNRIMKAILGLLVTTFLLFSCNLNQAANSEQDYVLKKLHNEVMQIHDDVMPRMSEIGRIKRQFKDFLKDGVYEAKADSIQQLIYQLDEADESMMNWMGEFKKPDYSNFENAQAVYANEKVKITNVKLKMESTIQKAQTFKSQL